MGSMVMGFGSAPPQARFEGVFLSRERFQIRFGKVLDGLI